MLGRVRSAMAQLVGGLGGGGSPRSPQHASPTAGASTAPSPSVLSEATGPNVTAAAAAATTTSSSATTTSSSCREKPRGSFSRPAFLQLTPEELLLADDHTGRAVQSPRESRRRLPWSTGYAEVINAGKSQHNEDQACCEAVFVEKRDSLRNNPGPKGTSGESEGSKGLYFYYWGLFDGHAGSGAAIMASKLLHFHIRDQLQDLVDILQDSSPPPICLQKGPRTFLTEPNKAPLAEDAEVPNTALPRFHMEKVVSHESLVVGAIENAFKQMDNQIEQERVTRQATGGCCALTVVYLLGKFYVANAGDSRAI